jgi:hypothetical protein
MIYMIRGIMNNDILKSLFEQNIMARMLVQGLPQDAKAWTVTTSQSAIKILSSLKIPINSSQITELFRKFERCGCGRFIIGRRGRLSRFRWNTDLAAIAKFISAEIHVQTSSPVDHMDDATGAGMLNHQFHLRQNLTITFDLPADLSSGDAQRISKFIESLPMAV